ncbi:MAG TPA: hypothetical protein VFY95_09695 [Sphingomicrobium sp.]
MPDLTVQPIGVDRLAQVYPLIRSATRVSFERWEEFGRELLCCGGGVLAVTAPDHCVHGVAAYRPSRNLRHEQTLDVEVIVAFDLRGDDRVRAALCRELERIAADCRCSAVNFTVAAKSAEPSSRVRSGLERLGLKLDTASFVRELPGEPD